MLALSRKTCVCSDYSPSNPSAIHPLYKMKETLCESSFQRSFLLFNLILPLCFSSYDLLHLFPVHPRTVSVLTNTAWELIAYLGVAVSVDRQCFRRRCQPFIINTKWAVFRWGTQPVCNGILMWTPVMGFTFAMPEFGNFQYNARPPLWWHTQKVGYCRSLWMHYVLLYLL